MRTISLPIIRRGQVDILIFHAEILPPVQTGHQLHCKPDVDIYRLEICVHSSGLMLSIFLSLFLLFAIIHVNFDADWNSSNIKSSLLFAIGTRQHLVKCKRTIRNQLFGQKLANKKNDKRSKIQKSLNYNLKTNYKKKQKDIHAHTGISRVDKSAHENNHRIHVKRLLTTLTTQSLSSTVWE